MEQKTDAQKTILIVEDEKNIVDILRFNLQREGYRTVEAYDGPGQQRARHHPHRPGGGGRQGIRS